MGVKQPYPLRTRIPSDQSWAYHVLAYKTKEDKNAVKFYIFPKISLQRNQRLLKPDAKKYAKYLKSKEGGGYESVVINILPTPLVAGWVSISVVLTDGLVGFLPLLRIHICMCCRESFTYCSNDALLLNFDLQSHLSCRINLYWNMNYHSFINAFSIIS